MVSRIVAIPTIEALGTLRPLVASLLRDPAVDLVVLMDNGHGPKGVEWMAELEAGADEARVLRVPARGVGLYEMWNWALAISRITRPDPHVLLLNDDVVAPEGLVTYLSDALVADPDLWVVGPNYNRPVSEGVDDPRTVRRVHGTYRHGGLPGWCMMVAADRWQGLVDERFRWWCGDDDLCFKVMRDGGHLGLLTGVPLDHEHETTARNHQWTQDAKLGDAKLFRDLWGPIDSHDLYAAMGGT